MVTLATILPRRRGGRRNFDLRDTGLDCAAALVAQKESIVTFGSPLRPVTSKPLGIPSRRAPVR